MPEIEVNKDDLLKYTVDANVRALIMIQNMLSNEHIEEAKEYIDEILKSDKKEVNKEIEIPKFILKEIEED